MKVLVCGGRKFANNELLDRSLRMIDRNKGPIRLIIHGAAPGADSLAHEWATGCGVPVQSFPADWKRHGKAAGPIRNRTMLEEGKPDLVIAFDGGRGTADMIRQARAKGLHLIEVKSPT